jgi:hypothetical protein
MGMLFLLILFIVFAVAIGMMMRAPKPPNVNQTKKVSDKTYEERIDPDLDEGSGFRDSRMDRDRERYRDRRHNRHRGRPMPRERLPESERYQMGNGTSRFRDDDF